MLDRWSVMTPRAKALVMAALIILVPVGGWAGYNVGRWLAIH